MTLSEKQVSFDKGFLSFNRRVNRPICNNPQYSWSSEDEVSRDWQMLLPPKHSAKRRGDVQVLNITCGNNDVFGVSGEVTANNGLVFFYDGYYFFASKEAP
jgi:hypothetical protein